MTAEIVTLPDLEGDARRAPLKLTPQSEDLNNLAAQLKQDNKLVAACIAMRRAVAISPESGFLWNHLGSVLWNMGQFYEAQSCYEKSKELMGDDAGLLVNYSLLLSSLRRYDEAKECVNRACKLRPDDKHMQWTKAVIYLSQGEWDEGFREYESRFEYRGPRYYPKMPFPQWKGEDLNGKLLFVQAEQGIGDRILFSRYLAWVCEKWPDARLQVLISSHDQIPLEALFWGFEQKYNIKFLHRGIPFPKADYGIYLLSLATIYDTMPDRVPPDPGLIRKRVMEEFKSVELPKPLVKAIKVGVTWTGNPAMTRNDERSIPPELMLELESDARVQLYSLQFGDPALHRLDATQLVCDLVPDISEHGKGILGTAVCMMHLDLIITVCTANCHLAGALGIPCWTLLCYDPYWPWGREGDTTAWYPSMKLYRQRAPGDWREVISRVKSDLRVFASGLLMNQEDKNYG